MVKDKTQIIKSIHEFHDAIKGLYPVKKIILYGSYARGTANKDSDIDIGIVIDADDHSRRIEITADLFHHARKIDTYIEPKCIFLDEYLNCDRTSILAEIKRTGTELVTV